jgi:hypothetical protein
MRIFLATIVAAFMLIAGQAPASAATAGQALVQKPTYAPANAQVEKAYWGHRRWYRHRWYRPYRWYRPWGWRHRHWRRW